MIILQHLSRLHLNKNRLECLKIFLEQNPDIHNLEQLLTVNGIGPKNLRKMCDSLLQLHSNKDSIQQQHDKFTVKEDTVSKPKLPINIVTPSAILQVSHFNLLSFLVKKKIWSVK